MKLDSKIPAGPFRSPGGLRGQARIAGRGRSAKTGSDASQKSGARAAAS